MLRKLSLAIAVSWATSAMALDTPAPLSNQNGLVSVYKEAVDNNADLAAARADEEKARLNLKLDLQQAFLGAQEAWERLEVVRKSLETAREARRIVQEQYQQGAADVALLLQTQVGVTATETRAAAARYDYLTALSNLQRAKGELGEDAQRSQ